MKVYAKHLPYFETGHLGDVIADMRRMGPPTIRVVLFGGEFYAIEGSHRLFAADYLGFTPHFIVEYPDADTDSDEFWAGVKDRLPCYEFT